MRFLLFSVFLMAFCSPSANVEAPKTVNQNPEPVLPIQVGAARMDAYLPLLENKKAALCVNHTAALNGMHLLDTLLKRQVHVVKVFAPEHGFRGNADAGEQIKDGKDSKTGIEIQSLYGSKKRPSREDLSGIDVVVFDIQDVGARFYTYISTLNYLLDACGEYGVEIVVLDRPNPNGHYVDGPILEEKYRSFVGIAPLPVVHGCTVGELAKMFVGEGWIATKTQPKLTVIPCLHYTHQTPYTLPIPPSPNLPNQRAIYLYPSLCFFEGTDISVGRGTDRPFQVVGHPDFPDIQAQFTPRSTKGAKYPKHENKTCSGWDMSNRPAEDFRKNRLDLRYLINAFAAFPKKETFFLSNNFFEKLAGTATFRQQILNGMDEASIRASWEKGLLEFKKIRSSYLLYEQ